MVAETMDRLISKRDWQISICPGLVLTISLIWCYAVYSAVAPISYVSFSFVLGALAFAYLRTYETHRWQITISTQEILIGASFLLLGLVVHWSGLFFSLGGDELYHSEQASFLLRFIRDRIQPSLADTTVEQYRASMWHLFDLRHMAVIDIWRIVSVLVLLGAFFFYAILRQLPRRWWLELILIAVAIYVGRILSMAPEQHPPLRALPLFFSSLVFGLNNFAFRIPGLLVVSSMALWVFRTVSSTSPQQPLWWRYLMSAFTMFIPVVFYVTEAVEPSVWGYAVYVGVLLATFNFLQTKNSEWILVAAVLAGLGLVLRQSTAVTWLLVGTIFLFSDKVRCPSWWWKVGAPGLLGVPYFLTVRALGHTAESKMSPIQSLVLSAKNGVGLMSVLNSTTLPWVVFTVLLLGFVVWRGRTRDLSLFLVAIPTYVMFHVIWEYLWGLGRYQAEYVAPFIVYALILACIYATSKARVLISSLGILLIFTTIEVNSNLSLDTNYAQWPRMRITTTASFPFRDAFGYLKRKETEGHFALLGGEPWYGHMVAWLGGFSFFETNQWRVRQDQMDDFVKDAHDLESLRTFCIEHDIRYLVSETGTRRENQHRTKSVNDIISALEENSPIQAPLFFKIDSLSGDSFFKSNGGGILDIYRVKSG